LFILDHNFWTRNARKSIKGSKDSDYDPKTTSLMTSLTRNPHPQPKNLFSSAIY